MARLIDGRSLCHDISFAFFAGVQDRIFSMAVSSTVSLMVFSMVSSSERRRSSCKSRVRGVNTGHDGRGHYGKLVFVLHNS